jgi:adenosylcobinamide kinase/adenosylcobinamide-phosphate guanylyltransferase
MLSVVTGGSGSGKSAFAEERLCSIAQGEKVYLAVMRAADEESRARVRRHRLLRQGKGFRLVEKPLDLKELSFSGTESVLLEDLPMLLANEMFRADGKAPKEPEEVLEELLHLERSVRDLVVVTGNLFEDGALYDEMTSRYLEVLGGWNRQLCRMAQERTEVVYGIPIPF